MKLTVNCANCFDLIQRHRCKSGNYFCSTDCKAQWQRRTKPVTREWLVQKYTVEKLDCSKIAKLVDRNPKRVWEWLKNEEILTRPRGAATSGCSFKTGQRSAFAGMRHKAKTKRFLSAQKIKIGSCPALINGVHWLKVYPKRKPASWRGGITPERQAVYSSPRWKRTVKKVWAKDNATCQKCGLYQADNRLVRFEIHHIKPFEHRKLRFTVSNLTLLCRPCHCWVHSSKNKRKLFTK